MVDHNAIMGNGVSLEPLMFSGRACAAFALRGSNAGQARPLNDKTEPSTQLSTFPARCHRILFIPAPGTPSEGSGVVHNQHHNRYNPIHHGGSGSSAI
jgi:hypothetical protein